MNSENLKRYKYVKISRSNFFTTTIHSLHSVWSESKKKKSGRKVKMSLNSDYLCILIKKYIKLQKYMLYYLYTFITLCKSILRRPIIHKRIKSLKNARTHNIVAS